LLLHTGREHKAAALETTSSAERETHQMANYTDVKGDTTTSAIQSNITTVLQTIDDPRGRKNNSNFLYQADPRRKASDFGSYPIIYIEDYSHSDNNQNVGGNLFQTTATAEIHIVAEDDSRQQKQWHDQITDQLTYLFNFGERQSLAENGVSQPEIVRNQRFTGVDAADQPVIRRELEVEMDMQIDMERVEGDPYA